MQKKEGFKANLLDSHKYSREREREKERGEDEESS
jgi:hypothetical protein